MLSQDTLESLSFAKGKDRYFKQQQRLTKDIGLSETDGARELIKANLGSLADIIAERSKGEPFCENLINIGQHKTALVSLMCAFQGVMAMSPLVRVMDRIGRAIEAECWAEGLLKFDEKKARVLERKVRLKHGNVKYRRQSARSLAARGGYKVEGWDQKLRIKLGEFLVNLVLEVCSDVFVLSKTSVSARRAGKTYDQESFVITLTPEAQSTMDSVAQAMCELAPMLLPMIEKPDHWSALVGGGYKDQAIKKLRPLVRIRYGNKEHRALLTKAIKDGQMQGVLDAVNAVQSVGFKINTRILSLIKWTREFGFDVPGLPPVKDFDLKPLPENWVSMSQDQKRLWRKEAANINVKNIGLVGARAVFAHDIETASLLSDAPAFYIPHSLDFRGRIYGMASFNFQRGDYVRALFLFADGKPIGDEGLKWLAIHLANCGDFGKVSKRSMETRLQWVNDNLESILDTAQNPWGMINWWSKADSPFLFVAACMDYAEALTQGPGYVSHLPVSWDGSCSGIQHLTAMMRSPEGAYVNLTPSEEPQDVYSAVAERVVERLKQAAAKGDEHAKAWLRFGFGRSEAKRGVMTYAYSSRAFGMAEQIRQDLMTPLADKVLRGDLAEHPFGEEQGFKEAGYMGKLLCDTIEDFIHAPAAAMSFLRKVAQGLAHEGKSATWVTPLGLPVVSWYPENETTMIKLFLYDRGFKIPVQAKTDIGATKTINKEKSANAIAPNFVHALDACHLMMVVNAAKAEGIEAQALVHDSFGCLAADAGRYNAIIREQFVRLYTEFDVLDDIRNHALKQISEANASRIPEVPNKGTLDLSEVLSSDYAFA